MLDNKRLRVVVSSYLITRGEIGGMKNVPSKKTSGYNLLELIFAITILGIGLGISARVIEVSLHQDVQSRARMEAAALATELEAHARTEGHASLPLEKSIENDGGRFHASCVAAGPVEDLPGMEKIEISVEWERGRFNQTYRDRSLIRMEQD